MQSRALSPREPRHAMQLPGGSQFFPGRGTWVLSSPVAAPGWWRCSSGEIRGRAEGVSPLSRSALSLGVRPWVGCSGPVLGAQMCISWGMHAWVLVCAYIRIHSSASLSQDPGSLLRLGGHHDFAPFCLLSKSLKRGFRSSRGENSASFPPFYPRRN